MGCGGRLPMAGVAAGRRTLLPLFLFFFIAATTAALASALVAPEPAADMRAFTNLVQLTEAVLAPAWSSGGQAYTLHNSTVNASSSLRPVCVHTRTSARAITAPVTFADYDAQFSPLFHLTEDNSAVAIGRLEVERGCYVDVTAPIETAACVALLFSQDENCIYGNDDALDRNYTVADLHAGGAVRAELDAQPSLPASGLSGAELFTVFVNSFLPQRAWLRTVLPRSLDVLETAASAARAFAASTAALGDHDEVADMQRAQASELSGYLWHTYGPQLRLKWDVLYRLAVATLTRGGLAPAVRQPGGVGNVSESSITGEAGGAADTGCPLVDAWLSLRYRPASLTPEALAPYMEAALTQLATTLHELREPAAAAVVGSPSAAPLLRLLNGAYCVTTTYLIGITALLDQPLLRIIASVWVEMANHTDSWAWQAMQSAAPAHTLASASSFHASTQARVAALIHSLPSAAERGVVDCLAHFLDATTPLTASTPVSPTSCVQQLLEARRETAATRTDDLTTVFDLAAMTRTAVPDAVPGLSRYDGTTTFPFDTDAPLAWTAVQESARSFTAQGPVVVPGADTAADADVCPAATAVSAPHTAAVQERQGNWDWVYECAAGAYVWEPNATCAACPSACLATAAGVTAVFPVYCPGDGLLHGCPPRPRDARYAGTTSSGQTRAASVCRYTCANAYAAPMNFSCLSVSGTFYDTAATGNADASNGGGLTPCEGPSSMFPDWLSSRCAGHACYRFVGSGRTDAPLTCPFTLTHRVVSSALAPAVAAAIGVLPPQLLTWDGDATNAATPRPDAAADMSLSRTAASAVRPLPLFFRSGVTWEAEVALNATQLYAMHAALPRTLDGEEESEEGATSTTIAHELVSLHSLTDSSGESTDVRLVSWYLLSTMNTAKNVSAVTTSAYQASSEPAASPPPLRFALLLNMTMKANPARAADAASPSSLIVSSPHWEWTLSTQGASSADEAAITTTTVRLVLCRRTNTVTWYANSTTALGAPTVVDWPLWVWASSSPSAPHPSAYSLSVGGWVAGYADSQQWRLATGANSTTTTAQRLPLVFAHLPGTLRRFSSAAVALAPRVQRTLDAAESVWRTQVEEEVGVVQRDYVTQLTSLLALSRFVAASPAVTASISAALHALAVRPTVGLDGVCRPGYGTTTSSPAACEPCAEGAYTALSASSGRGACVCIPQRKPALSVDAATNQLVDTCEARSQGPAAPREALSPAAVLFVEEDVDEANSTAAAHIPIGWYAAPERGTLDVSVTCLYGLTVSTQVAVAAAAAALDNTSVGLRYTTGLGGEVCQVQAAARGVPVLAGEGGGEEEASGARSLTRPTYTTPRLYDLRLRAPPLTPSAVTMVNHTRLFADQTVLTVGVHHYALLPFYAVHSLLRLRGTTEYHLAFLAYALRSVTVSAELACGGRQRGASGRRRLTWAGASALHTTVLWLNLSQPVTEGCTLTLAVTAGEDVAVSEPTLPFSSWPYAYLRPPSGVPATSYLAPSATLTYTLLPPRDTFGETRTHHVLGEVSSFVIAGVLAVLSLTLATLHILSDHSPSLHPMPWRRFEREAAALSATPDAS